MKFWMNLYRQGWYHREGKPGTMPWHPGDVYPTREAALADIDTEAPYIATVPFEVDEATLYEAGGLRACSPYAPCSTPRPLRETRKEHLSGYAARAEAVYVAEVTDTNPPWRQVGG